MQSYCLMPIHPMKSFISHCEISFIILTHTNSNKLEVEVIIEPSWYSPIFLNERPKELPREESIVSSLNNENNDYRLFMKKYEKWKEEKDAQVNEIQERMDEKRYLLTICQVGDETMSNGDIDRKVYPRRTYQICSTNEDLPQY